MGKFTRGDTDSKQGVRVMDTEVVKEDRLRDFLITYFPSDPVQVREDVRAVRSPTVEPEAESDSSILLTAILSSDQPRV